MLNYPAAAMQPGYIIYDNYIEGDEKFANSQEKPIQSAQDTRHAASHLSLPLLQRTHRPHTQDQCRRHKIPIQIAQAPGFKSGQLA